MVVVLVPGNELINDRCQFFRKRVEAYAVLKGLDSVSVVNYLSQFARENGEAAITAEIDSVVPADLHSSRMPGREGLA